VGVQGEWEAHSTTSLALRSVADSPFKGNRFGVLPLEPSTLENGYATYQDGFRYTQK